MALLVGAPGSVKARCTTSPAEPGGGRSSPHRLNPRALLDLAVAHPQHGGREGRFDERAHARSCRSKAVQSGLYICLCFISIKIANI
jgi:hypothetical protein